MANESSVPLSHGLPETVLPQMPAPASAALEEAMAVAAGERKAALAQVAARFPRLLEAWAALAETATDPIEGYAYARVGYHRGLDALRGAGWRGSGYVRWRYASNRGFLRALEQLRARAAAIGEVDEAERCATFLHQLDPNWDRRDEN
ncbi:MAG TPA: DUF3151 family protein [Acidimicrobiales bacterium]|jgi:hypothetical protein|nr:DUF3151 family protein [Acidimicrobiales bacterium]